MPGRVPRAPFSFSRVKFSVLADSSGIGGNRPAQKWAAEMQLLISVDDKSVQVAKT
jgi:hypothetical protein